MIPSKSYATIQLLTYLYGFQVSRVVPGEWPRHQALLSPGVILPRPCRLPPLPPSSSLVHNIFPTIPRILPQSTALPHPAPTPDECAARKAYTLLRSLTRRHASNPDTIGSLQFTCGNVPTVFYTSSAIPVSTPQPQISSFWVCRYFNSISAFCFVRAHSPSSMYIRLRIINIVLSSLNTFEPFYWLLSGSSEQNQTYSLIRKE